MAALRKVAWLVNTLNQVGGGERFVLEGRNYLRDRGIETHVLTWDFDPRSLFDAVYDSARVTLLGSGQAKPRALSRIVAKAARRLRRIPVLRREIRRINPDMILSQNEYDCVSVFLATLLTPYRYALFVFGQMYQTPGDLAKYTTVFRRHLVEIRRSMDGYLDTIPLRASSKSIADRSIAESVSILQYVAVRRARRIFVLSEQTQWEVKMLYGRAARLLSGGGFPLSIFDYRPTRDLKKELGLAGKAVVFSFSRLVRKKRIDLCIRAFGDVAGRVADVHLLIGGTGPEEEGLKRLVGALGLEEKVTFVGHIKERDVWDYYCVCDVFVNLDVADFDIVAYVAAALGRRVVCSQTGVDPTLVGTGAFIMARGTQEGVAEALEKALQGRPGPLEETYRNRLKEYSWEACFGAMLKDLERQSRHDRGAEEGPSGVRGFERRLSLGGEK